MIEIYNYNILNNILTIQKRRMTFHLKVYLFKIFKFFFYIINHKKTILIYFGQFKNREV